MISNAHVHNQTSVATLSNAKETSFTAQQTEDINIQKEETFDQYLTAGEMNSSKLQVLSQRSYIKGYRGL